MFHKKQQEKFDREYFCIYDSKTGIYQNPVLAHGHLDVLRQMENLFKDPRERQNQLWLSAEDFSIFKLGEYNQKTGEIRPCNPIEHIANLHDIKAMVQRNEAEGTKLPTQGPSVVMNA